MVNPILEKLNRKKIEEEKYTLIQLKQALKDYYNGYCFTADKITSVYNPDAILRFFYAKDFEHSWFNSGYHLIATNTAKYRPV